MDFQLHTIWVVWTHRLLNGSNIPLNASSFLPPDSMKYQVTSSSSVSFHVRSPMPVSFTSSVSMIILTPLVLRHIVDLSIDSNRGRRKGFLWFPAPNYGSWNVNKSFAENVKMMSSCYDAWMYRLLLIRHSGHIPSYAFFYVPPFHWEPISFDSELRSVPEARCRCSQNWRNWKDGSETLVICQR